VTQLNFGWLGFNGGSAYSASDGIAALACCNTVIGSASGFLSWTIIEYLYHHKFSVIGAAMGYIVPFVWLLFFFLLRRVHLCNILDPVEVSACFGFYVFVCLFASLLLLLLFFQ
jgi:hypothetical protein